ncbi:DUF4290 domain-containing protein [Flavobacteriaceae bacterium M23B6Z8]
MTDNLEYNTERPKLIIPEYGRHIQKMVDYAVSISDKEERNKVAQAIIGVMGNLNPHLRDVPDFQHKLWDQLFIMSDFQLDVDCPYETLTKEKLMERPERLNYPQNFPKYRFYGNNIKKMIDVANSWEEGDMKQALKYTIANHMKKSFLNWNKDTVDDDVIFKHLYELSDGRINLAKWDEDLANSSELLRSRGKANTNSRSSNQSGKKNYRNNRNKKRY